MASGGGSTAVSDHGRNVGYRFHTVLVCICYRSVGFSTAQLGRALDTSSSGLLFTFLVLGFAPYGFVATGSRPVRYRKLLTPAS